MNVTKLITEKVVSQGKARSTAEVYSGWVMRYLAWCKSVGVAKELLGHDRIETTSTYAHARKDGVTATASPLAKLLANPEQVKERRAEREAPFTLRVFAG